MRWIDADKVIVTRNDYEKALTLEERLHRLLNNQPTVEAIPIEWIKKWCIKNYPTYPRIITEELLKKTETWRMIEDWEKENER